MNDSTPPTGVTAEAGATSMQMMRGALVAFLQPELDRGRLLRLQRDLLERIQRSGARRVLLDASALEIVDSVDFQTLRETLNMVGLMGAVAVVVGLRPGIVSSLVTLDVDVSGLRGAPNLHRALEMLENAGKPRKHKARLASARHTPVGSDTHRR